MEENEISLDELKKSIDTGCADLELILKWHQKHPQEAKEVEERARAAGSIMGGISEYDINEIVSHQPVDLHKLHESLSKMSFDFLHLGYYLGYLKYHR